MLSSAIPVPIATQLCGSDATRVGIAARSARNSAVPRSWAPPPVRTAPLRMTAARRASGICASPPCNAGGDCLERPLDPRLPLASRHPEDGAAARLVDHADLEIGFNHRGAPRTEL